MPKKTPKRLRGRSLALHLERTQQFKGVTRARTRQEYLTADYKLRHAIPLNIYDAARSYREEQGLTDRGLRSILGDSDFRSAWRTFRGGGRGGVAFEDLPRKRQRELARRGYQPTTFEEKMRAAQKLGWYPPQQEAIDKLRNISP